MKGKSRRRRQQAPAASRGGQRPGRGGRGNAARAQRVSQRQPDRSSGLEAGSTLAAAATETSSADVDGFMDTNLYAGMVRLVEEEGWDPEFAAAYLGQAVVETGKQELEELDVVERGSGAGRGMLQYTGARRGPYDQARSEAIAAGQDPNDINWQLDYALNQDDSGMDLDAMREGLTNPDENYRFTPGWGVQSGYSPNGESYGNRFSDANSLMDAYGDDRLAGYTRALTGEYVRPGVTHMDRRLDASRRIMSDYSATLPQEELSPRIARGGNTMRVQ